MLIHKHMEKILFVIKNAASPWQEKNKNPHSDLKQ